MNHRSRLIAAADTLHALTEPRAYRDALTTKEAAEIVVGMANSGLLDPVMVRALVEVSGEPTPEVVHPAGLTDREIAVLGLLARGLQTKQIARHFDVSPKTIDTHIQSAYRKIGVSTRAAVTLLRCRMGSSAQEKSRWSTGPSLRSFEVRRNPRRDMTPTATLKEIQR